MASDDEEPQSAQEERPPPDAEMLPPDHPMMARIQAALHTQLSRQRDIQKMKLSEQKEELARQTRAREDVGVELYSVQQQLATLQISLDTFHERQAELQTLRTDADAQLRDLKALYAEQLRETRERRSKHDVDVAELDQLAATTRQMEAVTAQVSSEIAVTRRATYKTEEAISKLESDKQRQDALIDGLNERIKRSKEQLELTEAQLAAQRSESSSAQRTLADATSEMEKIRFDKQQLLSQWKSSVIGMQKRDAALQLTRDAMRTMAEELRSLDTSEVKARLEVKREQEANERHTLTRNRLEAELRTLTGASERLRSSRAVSEERFGMLNKAIEQTQAELNRVVVQTAQVESEARAVEGQATKLQNVARQTSAAAAATVGDRIVLEKGASIAAAETEKLRGTVAAVELDEAERQNKNARIAVDLLNTKAAVEALRTDMERSNAEYAEKEVLVARYEVEARRRNAQIENKQRELDLLNRKFDGLMKSRAGVADLDEEAGPLEATIVSLKADIASKAAESNELQRLWIARQAELVALLQSNETVAGEQQELRTRLAILGQKSARVNAELEAQRKETADNGRQERGLHLELSKINRLIADYEGRQKDLADEIFMLESSFTDKLKEDERDAVSVEARIVALHEEKEQLLVEVGEAEKQARLIQQKIALERETQAALDPEVGNTEQRTMQREIHRMKLRKAQLQRRQEMILSEMERAIYKRDNIEAKGKVTAGKRGAPPTQAALKKQLGELARSLRATSTELDGSKAEVASLKRLQAERGALVDQRTAELDEAKALAGEAERSRQQMRLEAKLQRYTLRAAQVNAEHLEAAIASAGAGVALDAAAAAGGPAALEQALRESEAMRTRLVDVGMVLASEFDALAPEVRGIVEA